MSEATTPTPAGWYPDPAGGPRNRWWDGTVWTETFSESHPNAGGVAPTGVRTNTVWIWLAVVVPYLTLPFLFTIDLAPIFRASASGSSRDLLMVQANLLTSPGIIALTVLGWVITAALIVCAYLDWRALKAAGVPQPFHWAWAFLILVVNFPIYVIGRSVIVKRRTGAGIAPLWAAIGMLVVAAIVVIIWMTTVVLGGIRSVPFS